MQPAQPLKPFRAFAPRLSSRQSRYCLFQPYVLAGCAYHNLKLARLHCPVHIAVQNLQVFRLQGESDLPGFTRLQGYPLKTAQLRIVGNDTAHLIAYIQLHHLVTRTFSSIRNVDFNRIFALRMLLQRRDFQIGVSKSRIAQTETERIQFAR